MEYRRQEITLLNFFSFFYRFVRFLLPLFFCNRSQRLAEHTHPYAYKQFLTAGFIDKFAFTSFSLSQRRKLYTYRLAQTRNVQKKPKELQGFSHQCLLKIVNKNLSIFYFFLCFLIKCTLNRLSLSVFAQGLKVFTSILKHEISIILSLTSHS